MGVWIKGLCSSAAGPLWLTAEHQPPTSCSACVIPAVGLGGVVSSTLLSVLVSLCHVGCRDNLLPTVTSTGVHNPFTQDFFLLNWAPFSSHNAEEGGKVSSSTQNSHSQGTAFSLPQHLHHSETEAELLSSFISPDVTGKLITAFLSIICLWKYLHPAQNPHTSPPNTDYAYTLMKPSPNILAANCKVCLTVSRARKHFRLCNRLNDTPWTLRAEAGQCSIKCHKSYLLPARPHAKIHLHVLHHWVGSPRCTLWLTDTHSHTCTDRECNPHTELFSFHYVFHRKLPP